MNKFLHFKRRQIIMIAFRTTILNNDSRQVDIAVYIRMILASNRER